MNPEVEDRAAELRRQRLPFVHAPALVVHGERDGLVPPAYAEEFASLIPDARVEMIPGAGHYPMLDEEDAFVAAVEAFLGR